MRSLIVEDRDGNVLRICPEFVMLTVLHADGTRLGAWFGETMVLEVVGEEKDVRWLFEAMSGRCVGDRTQARFNVRAVLKTRNTIDVSYAQATHVLRGGSSDG